MHVSCARESCTDALQPTRSSRLLSLSSLCAGPYLHLIMAFRGASCVLVFEVHLCFAFARISQTVYSTFLAHLTSLLVATGTQKKIRKGRTGVRKRLTSLRDSSAVLFSWPSALQPFRPNVSEKISYRQPFRVPSVRHIPRLLVRFDFPSPSSALVSPQQRSKPKADHLIKLVFSVFFLFLFIIAPPPDPLSPPPPPSLDLITDTLAVYRPSLATCAGCGTHDRNHATPVD